jgi:hypothetical protein
MQRALTTEDCSVLLNELGDGARRPASKISDGVGDRDRFSARPLIGTDRENAFDDGGRNAFSNAARPRVLRRLIDKPQFLANDRADDVRGLAIGDRCTSRQRIFFAEMSRRSERDKGDCGYVTRIDVRILPSPEGEQIAPSLMTYSAWARRFCMKWWGRSMVQASPDACSSFSTW